MTEHNGIMTEEDMNYALHGDRPRYIMLSNFLGSDKWPLTYYVHDDYTGFSEKFGSFKEAEAACRARNIGLDNLTTDQLRALACEFGHDGGDMDEMELERVRENFRPQYAAPPVQTTFDESLIPF